MHLTPVDTGDHIHIILVAAGSGARCDTPRPKQYMPLGEHCVLQHSFLRLRALFPHAFIAVVTHPQHHDWLNELCQFDERTMCIDGGGERQQSVAAGVDACTQQSVPPSVILVHDAARPFVSGATCQRLLDGLLTHKAVIPAVAVADTLKHVQAGVVRETVDRSNLVSVQTPQAFDAQTLHMLHQRFDGMHNTDDAGLCEQANIAVAQVEGDSMTFKITTRQELTIAQQLLAHRQETRTGSGYDVHRLIDAEHDDAMIRLGGIDIPHSAVLQGHSDADVVLHALTDAILGAIGEGDIGQHFPPTNQAHAGQNSADFVVFACERLAAHSGYINNLDITIIGERPKISPYREAMRDRIAAIAAIEPSRINIKATTTEKLGFEGRREGLACHAIAHVTLTGELDINEP